MFNGSDLNGEKEKTLLNFSTTEDRASLFEDQELIFSPRQKKKTQHKSLKKGINLKNGQLNFRIVGYQGTHNISVLDLVHYIPFSRLKAAAKKFLKYSGIKKKRKKDRIRKKHSNMAKKRTLPMTMEPQFDFQPEGPDQKKQHQPQSVLGSNFVKIYPLGNIESHPEMVEFELLDLDHVWAMGPSTRFVV